MSKYIKNNKGMTIVELIVAMSIFIIVITLAVGGFVSIIRLQGQTESMTDVQQNSRIALEQITRLSRQAEELDIENIGIDQDNLSITIGGNSVCFKIDNDRLKKFTNINCTGSGLTLTSDDVKVTKFYFDKIAGIPATLNIYITIKPKNNTGVASSDELNLNTSVLLSGLK